MEIWLVLVGDAGHLMPQEYDQLAVCYHALAECRGRDMRWEISSRNRRIVVDFCEKHLLWRDRLLTNAFPSEEHALKLGYWQTSECGCSE